jgi:hypothetical protein
MIKSKIDGDLVRNVGLLLVARRLLRRAARELLLDQRSLDGRRCARFVGPESALAA